MTPQELEAWYDAEVAPVLLEIRNRCAERGVSFLALVDYSGEGDIGRTVTMPRGDAAPAVIRYANGLAQAWEPGGRVNIDRFLFAVCREANERGHSSVCLAQLGVPPEPPSVATRAAGGG